MKATGYRGETCYEDQPAVMGDNVITASGLAPLEFARCIFEKLGIFAPDKLDAWYKLFKTTDTHTKHFSGYLLGLSGGTAHLLRISAW